MYLFQLIWNYFVREHWEVFEKEFSANILAEQENLGSQTSSFGNLYQLLVFDDLNKIN